MKWKVQDIETGHCQSDPTNMQGRCCGPHDMKKVVATKTGCE